MVKAGFTAGQCYSSMLGRAYLEEMVQVGAVDIGAVGKGIAEVVQSGLAIMLQVWHDVWRVMPPQQPQHLQPIRQPAHKASRNISRSTVMLLPLPSSKPQLKGDMDRSLKAAFESDHGFMDGRPVAHELVPQISYISSSKPISRVKCTTHSIH